jgi:triosephosphate isomerase
MNPDLKFSDLEQDPPQRGRKRPSERTSNFSRIGVKPPLIVANWKMHGTQAEAATLARQILNGGREIRNVEVVLAPPFTALPTVSAITIDSAIQLAAQNVHWEIEGAFTGEISPKMVRELGCQYVIIGHSERRRLFQESDQAVGKKILAALRADLRPIVCVGETWRERREGETKAVIARQLRAALKGVGKSAIEKVAIAYEPVWAIGTGRNATPEQIASVHGWVRELLRRMRGKKEAEKCRILYGGSVRPDNAAELAKVPEVNGLLVGGASLKAEAFLSIVRAFRSESAAEL